MSTYKNKTEKVMVAHRISPGDRWSIKPKGAKVYDSLTDMLQHLYEKGGHTEFYINASDGYISIEHVTKVEVIPEPSKKYSLYGDD